MLADEIQRLSELFKRAGDAAPCVEKIRKGLLQLGLEPEQPLVIMDTTVG